MTEIESYEKYCKSYSDDTNYEAKSKALLMLYIQNWIVRLQSNTEKEYTDYSLSQFIEDNFSKKREDSKEDALSYIIDGAMDAFRIISKCMREKIIRENVMMPSYKVKEPNTKGLEAAINGLFSLLAPLAKAEILPRSLVRRTIRL